MTGAWIYGIVSHILSSSSHQTTPQIWWHLVKARAKQLGQSGKLVFHEKVIDEEGSITELKIWQVPKSTDYPEGLRYRCAYVLAGEKAPAVLYDLHRGKSHHRHFEGIEQPYRFESVRKLIQDFRTDVDRIKTAKRGTAP